MSSEGLSLSPDQDHKTMDGGGEKREKMVKYGELLILGYNGALPQGKTRERGPGHVQSLDFQEQSRVRC